MAELCLKCSKEVRGRQEAILCDKCQLWCHRTCGPGIDRALYRRMVKREVTIDRQCLKCSTPETAQVEYDLDPVPGTTQVDDLDPTPGTTQIEDDLDPAPGTTQVDTYPLESTHLHDTSRQFLPDVNSIHDTLDMRNATYTIDHGEDVMNFGEYHIPSQME